MKKPEGVGCRHCKNWYWYIDACNAYSEDEVEDTLSPENIDCNRFELKTESEPGAEHYDPLPPKEIVDLVHSLITCPECGSHDTIKDGFKFSRSRGRVQRYQCKHCYRKFIKPMEVK